MVFSTEQILSLCGAVVAIGSAMAVIWRVTKPYVALPTRIKKLEERSEKDYERGKVLCRAMLGLLDYELTDKKDKAGIERASKELHDFLIDN